ncbi:unnamed protein product [Rhizophagus irregularis]|nr:unnamed protein product [Rhizophagus irregularis]
MESGVFKYLDELTFLDKRPKFNKTANDSDDNPEFKWYHKLLIIILHLIACILMSIRHKSRPALIKASRFVSRHQGLMLKILTDISPVNLLVSPNVEVKDNAILSIGIVHEIFRIFYFLGVKLEAIDKEFFEWCQIVTASTKGVQDFRLIFTAILKYVKRPDNDYCGNLKKPELSIDILNYHMQNFRRISIKLEKGDNIEEILSGLYNKDVDDLNDS